MKNYYYKFNIQKAFGNLYRENTVVIVVKNSNGEYLLGDKPNFYPSDITRLLGGGVKEGEDITEAAIRELKEELGIVALSQDLKVIASVNITAVDKVENKFNTVISIVELKIPVDRYQVGYDVESISALSVQQLKDLIRNYQKLSGDDWYRGEEGEFCWKDFGKIYSKIHQLVLDLTKAY